MMKEYAADVEQKGKEPIGLEDEVKPKVDPLSSKTLACGQKSCEACSLNSCRIEHEY